MKVPSLFLLRPERDPRGFEHRAVSFPLRIFWGLLLSAAFLLAGCGIEDAPPHPPPAAEEAPAQPAPEIHIVVDAPDSLVTHERGGEAEFSLLLDGAPGGQLSLVVATSDESEGTVMPQTITFSDDGWDIPQIITVTGVDDEEEDGNQTYTIFLVPVLEGLAEEAGIAGLALSVVNADDETPGLTVQGEQMSFSEAGGQGAFKLLLNAEPNGDVVVEIGCTDPSEALFRDGEGNLGEALTLVFTPEDWNEPRQVLLVGQVDGLVDGDQILELSVSVDSDATTDTTGYGELDPQSVEVVVTDDDTEGITVQIRRGCQVGI